VADHIPLSDSPRLRRTPATAVVSPSGLVTLPEEWRESPVIEPHAPETVCLDLSNITPERLNGVALFSFSRGDFLWALADHGRPVTFSAQQLQLLADAFETIGAELGDGVGGIAVPEDV